MTTRAVLYARVSGDDRNNATSSIEGQLDLCRDYANAQGWQVVSELAEDSRGASGASVDLPQLTNALSLARDGRFDVLVTREMDRLARNLAKQLVLEKEFERLGVRIDYVIGDYQDSPEGQLSKHIRAVIAEYEREKIKERMVRGRRRKAKAGHVMLHGNAPYGYRAEQSDSDTTLIVFEREAAVVRMIFEWYLSNGWGSPTIARELNKRAVPPPSMAKSNNAPKAVQWNQAQIIRIIANETYAGKWHYGKRNRSGQNPEDYRIMVAVPAIIGPDTFAAAQAKREANKWTSRRNTQREYLLAKRAYCGECQAAMTAFTKQRRDGSDAYSYYRCPVPHTQGTHYMHRSCNMRKHFRADYWDDAVWQEITIFLTDEDNLSKGFERYESARQQASQPLHERLSVIEELITEKRRELSRLLELFLANSFDQDMLFEHQKRLEGAIASLQEESSAIRSNLEQHLTDKQIQQIRGFAAQIRDRLTYAEQDFSAKSRLLDLLSATVSFTIEDGCQVAYLHLKLDPDSPTRLANGLRKRNPSPPLESARSSNSPSAEEGSCSSIGMHSMGCRRS